ncbi:MAG: hypothetical protein J1E99_04455, partial [Muribaculaceae bacterium]|nr:hypothetical protein [Muribaculaceae bacterium]
MAEIREKIVPMADAPNPTKAKLWQQYHLIEDEQISIDRLVSSLSFGFWTYLFNQIPYRSGGMNLLKIFPNKTSGVGQRTIYNELQDIKPFRNRIAHHEAICFNSKGHIDMKYAEEKLDLIKKYV